MAATLPGRVMVTRQDHGTRGAIARVTIDNAAKLNTLNTHLMTEFVAAVEHLSADEDLRAVILAGTGNRAFIGGADIGEMAELGPETAEAFITQVHRCCECLRDCPVPVIARIDGYVLGAGLEIAASCDLRVASDTSRFGMPEVRVGIPSVVEAALLPGLIGWGRTRELLLTGDTIGVARALAWNLVEKVVPAMELDQTIGGWLESILAAGPRAVRSQKALIREWEDLPLREAIAAGIRAFRDAWTTDEPRRMMEGFVKRRRE